MDLNNGNLVDLLKQKQNEDPATFPPGNGSVDYFVRYENIRKYLTKNIHPHVNAGAMLTDGGY